MGEKPSIITEGEKTYRVFSSLEAANAARHEEWAKGQALTPSWRGNELQGEVGEALEAFIRLSIAAAKAGNLLKKVEREQSGFVGSRTDLAELADEIGDVIICADLAAMQVGVSSEKAWRNKFNKTSRKYGLSVLVSEEP